MYRNDLAAAHARIAALERELAERSRVQVPPPPSLVHDFPFSIPVASGPVGDDVVLSAGLADRAMERWSVAASPPPEPPPCPRRVSPQPPLPDEHTKPPLPHEHVCICNSPSFGDRLALGMSLFFYGMLAIAMISHFLRG